MIEKSSNKKRNLLAYGNWTSKAWGNSLNIKSKASCVYCYTGLINTGILFTLLSTYYATYAAETEMDKTLPLPVIKILSVIKDLVA